MLQIAGHPRVRPLTSSERTTVSFAADGKRQATTRPKTSHGFYRNQFIDTQAQ